MGRSTTVDAQTLAEWVLDAGARTLDLVGDLTDEQLRGPRCESVNPLLWELGHIAWFYEKWVLRHALGREPLQPDVDVLYDSAAVGHDTRWDLSLPSRPGTLAYMNRVRDRVLEALHATSGDGRLAYFAQYAVFHEDMHGEAFLYTRQTLGYPPPALPPLDPSLAPGDLPCPGRAGDVAVPGGVFLLGADDDGRFVFDNEKWAHPVELHGFKISTTAVSQEQFADFIADGGYQRRELWNDAGWQWRAAACADCPVYWRRDGTGWLRRHFNEWVPLEVERPMIHVNWYEADAWCRWAGRRLPTEAEWEAAAAGVPDDVTGGLSNLKRRFPWGDGFPTAATANLDGRTSGTIAVAALPAGDSAFGCRQMIGNVWEWTASDFLPYPGFEADPYREYSQPWFGSHKVLRGGCWATSSRLIRNTWRNYYTPDRRDVWAGFRSCERCD
ncbi:MAG: SUMF1/EgtB/PvdO family nonheme iron enzyme [Planctomycetes bacterium]|nr:SUMF1/EgtB/PvdO family nonheme iron enzyme [Planctomycetota bacterium]